MLKKCGEVLNKKCHISKSGHNNLNYLAVLKRQYLGYIIIFFAGREKHENDIIESELPTAEVTEVAIRT